MTGKLFRQEVLLAQQERWLGSIQLRPPRMGWTFFGFSLLAVGLILVLMIAGRYTRHESVDGLIVPSQGSLTVVAATQGTIVRRLVSEGQEVGLGEPLLEISSEQTSVELGELQKEINAQLRVKRERLQADLAAHSSLLMSRQRDLRTQISLYQSQTYQLEQQVVLQQQRADSALSLYEKWEKLGDRSVVSRAQLLQQRDLALQSAAEVRVLRQTGLELRRKTSALQAELEQSPAIASEQRNEIERQLSDVTQALLESEVRRAVVLRAPARGTVTSALVYPGQAVSAQQPLMTVLPKGSQLQAQLWLPTRAVGFIKMGDRVVIRYDAFPYQRFGQHFGRVISVSQSAVSGSQLSTLLGRPVAESHYQVQVALDSQSVLANGRREALKPGMTLRADVLLERRRLYEWVLEPLHGFTQSISTGSPSTKGSR